MEIVSSNDNNIELTGYETPSEMALVEFRVIEGMIQGAIDYKFNPENIKIKCVHIDLRNNTYILRVDEVLGEAVKWSLEATPIENFYKYLESGVMDDIEDLMFHEVDIPKGYMTMIDWVNDETKDNIFSLMDPVCRDLDLTRHDLMAIVDVMCENGLYNPDVYYDIIDGYVKYNIKHSLALNTNSYYLYNNGRKIKVTFDNGSSVMVNSDFPENKLLYKEFIIKKQMCELFFNIKSEVKMLLLNGKQA